MKGSIDMITLPSIETLYYLMERVGRVYINEEGSEIYVHTPIGTIVRYAGPDFSKMTNDEISKWIADQPFE